jgi:hypothetical protein
MSEEMVTITKKEHQRLLDIEGHMIQLENAGVDNWQGYRGYQRDVEITINGKKHTICPLNIGRFDLVTLSHPNNKIPVEDYTITYRSDEKSGILDKYCSGLENILIYNKNVVIHVAFTGNA